MAAPAARGIDREGPAAREDRHDPSREERDHRDSPTKRETRLDMRAVALAGAAVLVFRAPFSPTRKAVFLFGALPAFEYAVMCRNYGLGMLLHQAVRGFELWFGQRPQVTAELRAIVEADLTKT